MKNALLRSLLAAALLPAVGSGCRSAPEKLADPDKLLARQHLLWRSARETLATDQPNLMLIRSVEIYLCARTRSSVEAHYEGPDKADILKQLDSLREAYRDKVISLVDPRSFAVHLKPGVTPAQLRDAFMEIDKDYRRFEQLTSAK